MQVVPAIGARHGDEARCNQLAKQLQQACWAAFKANVAAAT